MEKSIKNPRRLSYFDVITDSVFQAYKDRGAISRDQFIISKDDRKEDPLNCIYDPSAGNSGTTWIFDKGKIPNFVYLGDSPSDFEIVTDYY